MTDTIETGAVLTAFQPGDRVRILRGAAYAADNGKIASVKYDSGNFPYPLRVLVDGRGGTELFAYGDVERVPGPPTAPAHLRAAAEVMDAQGLPLMAEALRYEANRLESTSAPKPPPTLADRLEELWEKRGRHGFELSIVREFAEILRAEKGAAK